MNLDPAYTFAALRDAALALPGVYADPQLNPAFRVRSRFLARLHDTLAVAVVRCTPEKRMALVAQDPVTFFVSTQFAASDRVLVRLATATRADLSDVVEAAWRLEAPRRLVRSYDADRALRASQATNA